MNCEIINVGTELLLGDTLNTHHQFLAKELSELGISVYHQCCVGDNPKRLEEALKNAFVRSDMVVLTGGLGPTVDDLTKRTAAKAMGVSLVRNPRCEQKIRKYFEGIGREMPANNLLQADVPEGAVIFANGNGTAPGCAIEKDGKIAILLPGPPCELVPMFRNEVLPYLSRKCGTVIFSQNLNIFGVGESKVDDLLSEFFQNENPTVAPYAKENEVLVRITALAENENSARALIEPVACEIKKILGDSVYGTDSQGLEYVLVDLLRENHLTVATAESCTGGMIAQRITSAAGSSHVFGLGIVSYSVEQKIKTLGVDKDIIEEYGVYSGETAAAMAERVREMAQSDIGIATTGVAGPGGGSGKILAGTVFLAVNGRNGTVVQQLKRQNHCRENVRAYASSYALDMCRMYVKGE